MSRPHRRAAFLFRRDLRLDDNTGLARAASLAAEVVPCFVFDPRQQEGANEYFSAPGSRFLLETAAIHGLETRRPPGLGDYPQPIVDHRRESARAKRLYEAAR